MVIYKDETYKGYRMTFESIVPGSVLTSVYDRNGKSFGAVGGSPTKADGFETAKRYIDDGSWLKSKIEHQKYIDRIDHRSRQMSMPKKGDYWGEGRVKMKPKYRLFVKPEGEEEYKSTSKTFTDRSHAETYANLETAAGMGEVYEVREIKNRKS